MKQHHSLDPKVAKQVGINAALIIWNLSYLQSQRESQGGDEFYHEGKWWVRHSYESLAEWHDYLSIPQIKRIMKKLEDDGHISKASLGKNPWDRTTYWHVSPVFMHSTESHHASDASVLSDSTKSYDVQQKNNNKQRPAKFDEFWSLYPKKVDKKNSRAKFIKLPDSEQQLAIAYLKTKPFAETMRTAPKENPTQYVPCATKFIGGARWEDEPTTQPTNGRTAL